MCKLLRKKGRITAVVLAVSMLICGAFSSAQTGYVASAAKKAKISTKKITVETGAKKTIKIKNKARKASYIFKVSNKKICVVNKKGVVIGKKAGTARVIVYEKLNKKSKKLGTVNVTVKNAAADAQNGSNGTGSGTQNGSSTGTQNGTSNQGTNISTPNQGQDPSDPNAGTPTQAPSEPTPEPTPEATRDPYSVELFTLYMEDGKIETVDGNTCKVDMQFFEGEASGEWFSGKVVKNGNVPGSDVIKTYKEDGRVVHHSRVFLDGQDILGSPCKLYIEDVSVGETDDYIITKPIFICDNERIGFLETKDIQGRMIDNGDGTREVTYYWNDSVESVPLRKVTVPDSTPNKYTKEIFTFNISPGSSYSIKGQNGTAMMIYFGGSSDCANFKGSIALSDADTRLQYTNSQLVSRPDDIQTLSARYILSGTDKNGNPMKIYVENNGIDDNGMVTEPTIITDNPDFEYIETEQLHGTVSWENGLTIHMWAQH